MTSKLGQTFYFVCSNSKIQTYIYTLHFSKKQSVNNLDVIFHVDYFFSLKC